MMTQQMMRLPDEADLNMN